MLTFKKGLTVFFITLITVCSVYAQEEDWVHWQKKLFQTKADNAGNHETARFWRTQEPRVKEVRVTATLPDYPWVKVSGYRNRLVERCITCHDGISAVSPSHPPEFGCAVCHGGEPESLDKNQAHATLIYDPQAGTGKRNPSSLSVVEQSCGQLYCHSGHEHENRNHSERLKKSMMNTLAGVISGLRYQWAAQENKAARYATKAIQDEDGEIPRQWGALKKLDQLPFSTFLDIPEREKKPVRPVSKHPSDRILRKECFKCHIDSPPPSGEYRSQGCAACHFTYSKNGLYKGNDPTVSRTEPGHAAFHKLHVLPKRRVCVQCHKRFSIQPLGNEPSPIENRLQAESSEKEIVKVEINNEKKLSLFAGKGNIQGDIHTARGMDCIDCHTQRDIMGDGNLYSKQHQAVEIRCETCHGDANTYPMLLKIQDPKDEAIRLSKHYNGFSNTVGDWMAVTERKNKMTNVKVQNGKMVALGKESGRVYNIPLARDAEAHLIPQHRSRLECAACHSNWIAQCQGCHATINFGQNRIELKTAEKPPIKIQQPALMVGPRGKAAPMLAQPNRHFSLLDEKEKPVPALGIIGEFRGKYKEWHFTNPNTRSGSNLAYSLNPHSTGRKVRSCESCHLSPETLGLGKGDLIIGANNTGENDYLAPVNRSNLQIKASAFDPQAKVTMRGEILAGSHQPNARPFNQKEIVKILKAGNCIPCHDQYDDPIYQDINKSYAFQRTLEHRQLRDRILNSRQTQP